jgi:hypothetical protein
MRSVGPTRASVRLRLGDDYHESNELAGSSGFRGQRFKVVGHRKACDRNADLCEHRNMLRDLIRATSEPRALLAK